MGRSAGSRRTASPSYDTETTSINLSSRCPASMFVCTGPEAAPQGAVHPRVRAEGRGGGKDATVGTTTIVGGPGSVRRGAAPPACPARGAPGRGHETCARLLQSRTSFLCPIQSLGSSVGHSSVASSLIYRSSYTMTVPCFYSVAVCWILVRFFGASTGVNMC